jgi:hypothetical protein
MTERQARGADQSAAPPFMPIAFSAMLGQREAA